MSGIRYLEEKEELSVESVSNSMRCRATLKPTALANAGWRAVYPKCYKYSFARRALLKSAFSFDAYCSTGAFYSRISDLSEERKSLILSRRTATVAAVAATHHLLVEAANGG